MLEDLGNCVKIHDTVIPAVNIQVEGFPKFCGEDWYGIYFEVMFECGDLWEVSQAREASYIEVIIYKNWVGMARSRGGPGYTSHPVEKLDIEGWDGFLEFYESVWLCMEMFRTESFTELLDV
jgi:hypothetical protein